MRSRMRPAPTRPTRPCPTRLGSRLPTLQIEALVVPMRPLACLSRKRLATLWRSMGALSRPCAVLRALLRPARLVRARA